MRRFGLWCKMWLLASAVHMCSPGDALAQQGASIDLSAFRPALDPQGYITINSTTLLEPGELSLGIVSSWGLQVLTLSSDRGALGGDYAAGDRAYQVKHVVVPSFQIAYGLARWLEVAASFPFVVVKGDAGPNYVGGAGTENDRNFGFDWQGAGDIGLHGKVQFWSPSDRAPGLGFISTLRVPTRGSNNRKWLGEAWPTVETLFVTDMQFSRIRWAASAGLTVRSGDSAARSFENVDMAGDPNVPGTGETVQAPTFAIPWGAAISYALVKRKFDLLAEVFGSVPLGGKHYLPHEVVLGLKFFVGYNSYFQVGAGTGYWPGQEPAGNPNFRGFVGLLFEPGGGDRDHDGLMDKNDACPDDPEDYDSFEDRDGCPELDNDKDTIVDVEDKCVLQPEDNDAFEDEDGCPEVDNDEDKIVDVVDKCPITPEDKDDFEDTDGCPEFDNDRDRVLDVADKCPNVPEDKDGYEDKDGCPEENPKPVDPCLTGLKDPKKCPDLSLVVVTEDEIKILDKVYFRTNRATIRRISYPILNQVAEVLKRDPDIVLVEVGGHADERAPDGYNLRLTQARANSVCKYLISKGIAAKRMSPIGYGETRPVDPKHNRRAWAKNRRVEFKILKRASKTP